MENKVINPEELSLVELKALAWDQERIRDQAIANLRILNDLIERRKPEE